MAVVKLSIAGKFYQISCENGQEENLNRLALALDEKAKALLASAGHINEGLLLAMVALMVADELSATQKALKQQPDVLQAVDEDALLKLYGIVQRLEVLI